MSVLGPIGGDLLARRYRLIDRVGAGGMSVVWRARDEVLDRLVAVKWLGTELVDDGLYRNLVRREAWATARIKHPAIAAIYDYGEVSDRSGQSLAYVVMEMLDGESLAERLRRGPLPWREAVAICREIADALATAHEHGVVHRDISPDNVMLTTSGLRVFDFGIAAPIGEPDNDATGSTFGTPAYVAPERLDGRPAQTATDVYSLGVLLFEMLTGALPYPEDVWDAEAMPASRAVPRVRARGLPAPVARLCARCLAHDPDRRPTASEVAHRLAAAGRPLTLRRYLVPGGAVLAVAAIIAAVWLSTRASPSTPIDGQAGQSPTAPALAAASTPATGGSTAGSTAAAAGTAGPTTSSRTSPTSAAPVAPPTGRNPAAVAAAVDGVRQAIAQAADTGTDVDITQDLSNVFENQIATPLRADPNADVRTRIAAYNDKIYRRSTVEHRLTDANRDRLYTAVAALSTALGYSAA
jgi:serine/threonine protein kinase